MGVLWRVVKASVYATLLLLALGVVLTLMVWTKGLLVLLLAFGVFVKIIYDRLECRDWHAEKARKHRAEAWRNYQ